MKNNIHVCAFYHSILNSHSEIKTNMLVIITRWWKLCLWLVWLIPSTLNTCPKLLHGLINGREKELLASFRVDISVLWRQMSANLCIPLDINRDERGKYSRTHFTIWNLHWILRLWSRTCRTALQKGLLVEGRLLLLGCGMGWSWHRIGGGRQTRISVLIGRHVHSHAHLWRVRGGSLVHIWCIHRAAARNKQFAVM